MLIGHQLSVPRRPFQGGALQYGAVTLYVVDKLRLAHHVTDIDQVAIALDLFPELPDAAVCPHIQHAETLTNIVSRNGHQPFMGAVKLHQPGNVQICHPVAVSE